MVLTLDKSLEDKLRLVRAERYAAQSVARLALPEERVSKCLRYINSSHVEVWKHLKTEKSFYNGLLVCGSVWNCPVCAVKISERRKEELTIAFDKHKADGGFLAMMTLTFSHKKNDKLKVILKQFADAMLKFRAGKAYNELRRKMGLIGSIRVFEITYGLNGFHPHVHLGLFYTNEIDLPLYEYKFYQLWEKACAKFGLVVDRQYGLSLQNADDVDEYLSKHGTWSLENELSKSHIKKAKHKSMTPFDFLREVLTTGDTDYITLFQEYAEALKGKRQVQWSQGLKKRFLIIDKSDQELAIEKTEQAELLGLIPFEIWREILRKDKRADFLTLTEKEGFEIAMQKINKKESSGNEDSHE